MTQKRMKSVRVTVANREASAKEAMMKEKIFHANTRKGNQISDSKKLNRQQKKQKKSNSNTTKANRISDSKKFNLSRCQQQKKKKKSVPTCQEKSLAETDIVAHSQGSIFSQQDLMMEILSRLSVRALFRFKCVAKSWDITSDPYFKMKHQRHHANSTKFLLLHCNFKRKRCFHNFYSTSSLSSPEDVQKLDDLPPNADPDFHVLFGSCDGLVLIGVPSRSNDQLLLWNPSTRESILLPLPEFGIINSTFGLGYDQTTNDYVVLTIHDDMTQTPADPHCGILALKSGSWRKVCIKTRDLFCPCRSTFGHHMDPLAFVHGAFHWIPSSFVVVSLSISNETLTEIPFPEQMCYYPPSLIFQECGVSVLEGMLCISSSWRMIGGEDTFMLWAMKDYGIKESWTQLFKINFTRLNSARPIYRFADGDVLFDCRIKGGGVFCRSLRTSKGPVQLWFDWFHSFSGFSNTFDVITFTESLISPKSLL